MKAPAIRGPGSGRVFAVAVVLVLAGHSAQQPNARDVVDLATDPDVVKINGVDLGDQTGDRVASCDVNGDGVGDLIVTAEEADGVGNNRPTAGEAYVLLGKRGAWIGPIELSTDADVRIIGEETFDALIGVGCGDVDGDGFADVVLGAGNADSINNSRDKAGQLHLILGASSLPSLVDLAVDPGTILYGAVQGDAISLDVRVGDVNDDGLGDIVAEAANAVDKSGTVPNSGRIYVAFGRSTWPGSLDLLTQSDLTIYGIPDEHLGGSLTVDDLDGDGIDDIIAASNGDGPDDTRSLAGDIHVFLGRANWPAEIDLAVEASDMVVYGPDAGDQAGISGKGTGLGDLDGDGAVELLVGIWRADGRNNDASLTGEARTHEFAGVLPPSVDLLTDSDSVVYGADAGDFACSTVLAADVNADGIDDLGTGSSRGDGPNESRNRAGEVTVFYGWNPFPADLDMGLEEEDLIIFGELAEDRTGLRGTSDVNGDGVPELVAAISGAGANRISVVYLISPVDTDGDGVKQLPDNCPLVANPGQADSDVNGVGDACQGDYDGDGLADQDDCAPSDPQAGTPGEVAGLVLSGGATTILSWQPAAFADAYDVSRGAVADLDGNDYGSCQNSRDSDLTDTTFEDADIPLLNAGFFYLVRGRSLVCGLSGTYGNTSGGQERLNANPGACP